MEALTGADSTEPVAETESLLQMEPSCSLMARSRASGRTKDETRRIPTARSASAFLSQKLVASRERQ